jgi:hypothetical protein
VSDEDMIDEGEEDEMDEEAESFRNYKGKDNYGPIKTWKISHKINRYLYIYKYSHML